MDYCSFFVFNICNINECLNESPPGQLSSIAGAHSFTTPTTRDLFFFLSFFLRHMGQLVGGVAKLAHLTGRAGATQASR